MYLQQSGTLYDVYVKNDTYYQKFSKLFDDTYDENDQSFSAYERAIQEAIPELANLSEGDVSIHVLPENRYDKSSSQSEDVHNDIIGITRTTYTYEGDVSENLGVSTLTNLSERFTPDKSSLQNVLSKIQTLYKEDSTLHATIARYSNVENYVNDFATQSIDENGDKLITITAIENPLAYAIASLNSDLNDDSMFDCVDRTFFLTERSMEEKMKKWAEQREEENQSLWLNNDAKS